MLFIDISMVEVAAGAEAVVEGEAIDIDISILEQNLCQSWLIRFGEVEADFDLGDWDKVERREDVK